VKKLPIEIEAIYEELKKEITWLHGRWIVYRQLFGTSEKRIALLNECSPTLFYILQDVLIGEVQLSLCKLTDPPSTGKSDNLSLEHLQMLLEAHADASLALTGRAVLDPLKVSCQPFRTWRNKRLAHLDLDAAMRSSSNPMPGISRSMIEQALESVRKYMNAIEPTLLGQRGGI
jgi:hypothetical protein